MDVYFSRGTSHPWLRDPTDGSAWLFKPVVVHADRQQGEDWAEKVASEIGALLTIPCAVVHLAMRSGRAGCVSRDLRPRGWEIQPGALLLADVVSGYRPGIKGRAGHSLSNIQSALSGLDPPPNAALPAPFVAFDVFAGYLAFDALLANRDRHDHNWSVLLPPPDVSGGIALCGSYDHASSLGFNLLDAERSRRLAAGDIAVWARRGTAVKFEHDPARKAPALVSLALEALDRCSDLGRAYWFDRVSQLDRDSVRSVLAAVPDLSDATVNFCLELVMINRGRLLDGR